MSSENHHLLSYCQDREAVRYRETQAHALSPTGVWRWGPSLLLSKPGPSLDLGLSQSTNSIGLWAVGEMTYLPIQPPAGGGATSPNPMVFYGNQQGGCTKPTSPSVGSQVSFPLPPGPTATPETGVCHLGVSDCLPRPDFVVCKGCYEQCPHKSGGPRYQLFLFANEQRNPEE